ncbi:hypothetical protein SLEP1_g20672 [Rubroshorea leprosula]|uniref:Glycosyltransferase n=1 Tax=Rubroshorea leprosula TaxID=152421 RepID=A0AAV5JCM8_9ROSI|nr:hypothetical protein SLEP1_g20672 [Rubroshorea leprosula]
MYFCSNLPKADGIIANTFDDLEPIPIKAIADGVCVADAATPPMYYIGPLIAANSSTARHDCLDWLDKQPSRSVVFLCFGSRGTMSPEQVKEIANGLERSGQRFLWVVKNPPDDQKRKQTVVNKLDVDLDSLLPEGFLNRVEGRGMVVKAWAPQVAVLSHESVGGFVTHCGWNSVLETVVGGVPMIAWPLYAEQHLNRNVLVQDMKMAIPVEQREGDGFVSGTEVEKRVRELMESETGQKLKEKSWKMKQKALEAWGDSGSSIKALERTRHLCLNPSANCNSPFACLNLDTPFAYSLLPLLLLSLPHSGLRISAPLNSDPSSSPAFPVLLLQWGSFLRMYSAIRLLPLDGTMGHGGEYQGSLDRTNLPGDACLVLTTDAGLPTFTSASLMLLPSLVVLKVSLSISQSCVPHSLIILPSSPISACLSAIDKPL